MKKQITVASLVMLAGGAVTFLFSFLAFTKFGSFSASAWSSQGFFPIATIPALLGLAMAVVAVLNLVGTKLPDQILTFNWKQINATWGIAAAGMMIAWLIADFGGGDKGLGLIFMLIGSLAMAAGSVMDLLGMGNKMVSMPQGSAPGSVPPPGGMTPPPPPPGGSVPPPPPPPGR